MQHSFARNYAEMRLQPGAKPQKDMMQAFINQGLGKDELIQLVYIHMQVSPKTFPDSYAHGNSGLPAQTRPHKPCA